jgi:hypothetical protein
MDYYVIKFIILIVSFVLLAFRVKHNPHWMIGILVIALSIVPNSSIFSDERVVGGGFKLFYRYVYGIFSLWDILIILTFYVAFLANKNISRGVTIYNRYLYVIFFVWIASFFVGIYHAIIVRYGYTTITDVIRQVLPAVYLIISVYVTKIMITTRMGSGLEMQPFFG